MKLLMRMAGKPKKKIAPPELPVKKAASSGGTKPAWMITGEEAREAALAAQQVMGGNRAPEFWLKDGEEKLIRFRSSKPIALLWVYNVNLGGKKFAKYTAPAEGEEDLFESKMDAKRSLRAIYEIFDVEGYVSKKDGKRHKNVTRFFGTSARLYKQLCKIAERRGPLTGYDILISRQGSSTDTTYTLIPETPSPMSPAQQSAPRLSVDFEKYYAPPTIEQQRALLKRRSTHHEEVED